ncbi:MAG: glycosyltransferase family protein [Patescibacteria group bacterium]
MRKIVFFVVTEGRGHMSQALAMADILEANGDEIVAVITDKNQRPIPEYFSKRFEGKIFSFSSPNLVYRDSKKLSIFLTAKDIFKKLPTFFKNTKKIEKILEEKSPDLIINFYSLFLPIRNIFFKKKYPNIVIGNQFLLTNKKFLSFANLKNFFLAIKAIKIQNDLTLIKSNKTFALSFSKKFENLSNKKTKIVPPLIRKSIFEETPRLGNYIFIYLMNEGYMDDVINWHKNSPNVKIHCFTDSKKIDKFWRFSKNLIFHSLNERKFIKLMANSRAVITSGGFETFCESIFFKKPTMLIPTEGQFEQEFRSKIADKMGIAICSKNYDLEKIAKFTQTDEIKRDLENFRDWVKDGPKIFLEEIEKVLKNKI